MKKLNPLFLSIAPIDRRRIILFDLMSLIAATALGLSLTQLGWPRSSVNPSLVWTLSLPFYGSNFSGYPSKTWILPVAERVAPILPCLATWTGAFLASRLRGPRPRRRRLFRQPGFVGAVAALSVLIIESALLIISGVIDGRFRGSNSAALAEFAANAVILLAHHAGWSVAVSWLTLALIGQWRPEPTWVDRWGRALGLTWIFVGPMTSLLIDPSRIRVPGGETSSHLEISSRRMGTVHHPI
jgi:hypothetical protein